MKSNRAPLGFDPSIASRPERALRTGLALRIVDPLLVRASDNFAGRRHRANLVIAKECGDLGGDRHVIASVARLREPPAQLDRLRFGGHNDADRHLAGALVVGAVEGDGADRIAAKARLSFLRQPLSRLPTDLHESSPEECWCYAVSGRNHSGAGPDAASISGTKLRSSAATSAARLSTICRQRSGPPIGNWLVSSTPLTTARTARRETGRLSVALKPCPSMRPCTCMKAVIELLQVPTSN